MRDWLHVEDHCRGIEAVLLRGVPGEVYNIGGGQELTNLLVIDEICRGVDAAFASDPGLAARYPGAPAAQGRQSIELKSYVTDRKGHDRRYAIDETKARNQLGYLSTREFAQGFADTFPGISPTRVGGCRCSIARRGLASELGFNSGDRYGACHLGG